MALALKLAVAAGAAIVSVLLKEGKKALDTKINQKYGK